MTESPQISTDANGRKRLGVVEFSALCAFTMALAALAIDIMLPILNTLATDLGATDDNDAQLIIATLFLGMVSSQMIYGPASDAVGRRPMVFAGLLLFMFGTVVCMFSKDFNTMLVGRFLQGAGIAGPRTVIKSVVRDLYVGRAMAQVSSIMMGFFIIVPAVAPIIGATIIKFAPWQALFHTLLIMSVLVFGWYYMRQPETLAPQNRRSFSWAQFFSGCAEVLRIRKVVLYAIAAGIIFGCFSSYIYASEQIFRDIFERSEQFPYYFGLLALCIGASSLFNAFLVAKLGMRRICMIALTSQFVISGIALIWALTTDGNLPFVWFMIWAGIAFFMMGFLFGNFTALAMEPLGHLAGIGGSLTATITMALSWGIAMIIGSSYDKTLIPLLSGFTVLSIVSITIMVIADREKTPAGAES